MQTFDFVAGPAVLERTPRMLDAWLRGLPTCWLTSDEGPDTWSPLVVLGHFAPFDRFSQLQRAERSTEQLLEEFAVCRERSLADLVRLRLTNGDLARKGRHPEFGTVTLGQHLATWVAHDLTHIVQIGRAMAHGYRQAVGPWRAYLRVVRDAGSNG